MRVAVTGSTGLIGTALVTALREAGHDVVQLVRGTPRGPGDVEWDPAAGSVDLPGLVGVEAAVHLAGAGVGEKRWTDDYKRMLRDSRVLSTRTLVRALTSLDPLPRVLVSGSAIGYYGDRGDEELSETSGKGEGFLADLVQDWEAEADPARALNFCCWLGSGWQDRSGTASSGGAGSRCPTRLPHCSI
jgi:NAD dependent epimerase/dehydratase family enzyme